MDERPVTRYATSADGTRIAYQVAGSGPLDLVFDPGTPYPIDLLWEDPGFVRLARRLGGFARTLWFESRGIGASEGDFLDTMADPVAGSDLTAVIDACECQRVVLTAVGNHGPAAIAYASALPERVAALILVNTYAHYVREDDYPVGLAPDSVERFATRGSEAFAGGTTLEVLAPSKSGDDGFRAWWTRGQRLGISPDQARVHLQAVFRRDVRDLLPTLSVPTLVLHRQGNRYIRVGAGQYVAEHIPGAKYVELAGDDHMFFVGDTDALVDEIEEFLTGARQAPEGDVVMAAILFTDIVASTEQSASMGHRKWSALTDDHDAMVRATLQRHRGREVKATGDGFLATFDSTTRAVRAAKEIVTSATGMGVGVRAGVHTGEVEVRSDDVVGLAVSIAKRICDLAGPGEAFVSEAVKLHLVGSGIALSQKGTHILKGVPDEWRLFAVEGLTDRT